MITYISGGLSHGLFFNIYGSKRVGILPTPIWKEVLFIHPWGFVLRDLKICVFLVGHFDSVQRNKRTHTHTHTFVSFDYKSSMLSQQAIYNIQNQNGES